jgi:hypothetical protein
MTRRRDTTLRYGLCGISEAVRDFQNSLRISGKKTPRVVLKAARELRKRLEELEPIRPKRKRKKTRGIDTDVSWKDQK